MNENYRCSTQNILDAAYGVISKNVNRKDKKIWTENSGGHLLVSYEADNEKNEAEFIAEEIQKMKNTGHAYGDFVILYRTNAQSRIIEEVMLRNSIPYRIIGGIKFYQRKEVKDIIAYLRLINNFSDEVSLERIINEPKRGIGEITLGKWAQVAKEANENLIKTGLAILKFLPKANQPLAGKILNSKLDSIIKFSEFIVRMAGLKTSCQSLILSKKFSLNPVNEKYLLDGTEEGEMRHENVRELLTVAKKYEDYEGEEGLNLFLEEVALVFGLPIILIKTSNPCIL